MANRLHPGNETRRVWFRLVRFETHCVSNLEHPVELPHFAQVGDVESAAEVGREPLRQVVQHRFAVRGTLPAALLVLDDQPPDLPVSLNHRGVDRAIGRGPRRFEDSTNLLIQRLGRAGE